jgi:hypothetical protein
MMLSVEIATATNVVVSLRPYDAYATAAPGNYLVGPTPDFLVATGWVYSPNTTSFTPPPALPATVTAQAALVAARAALVQATDAVAAAIAAG